jgi:hypothetical protein
VEESLLGTLSAAFESLAFLFPPFLLCNSCYRPAATLFFLDMQKAPPQRLKIEPVSLGAGKGKGKLASTGPVDQPEPEPVPPHGRTKEMVASHPSCTCGSKHKLVLKCIDCAVPRHGVCIYGFSSDLEKEMFKRHHAFRCESCQPKFEASNTSEVPRPLPPQERFGCCGKQIDHVAIRKLGMWPCVGCHQWYHAKCIGIGPSAAESTTTATAGASSSTLKTLNSLLSQITSQWHCPACSVKMIPSLGIDLATALAKEGEPEPDPAAPNKEKSVPKRTKELGGASRSGSASRVSNASRSRKRSRALAPNSVVEE